MTQEFEYLMTLFKVKRNFLEGQIERGKVLGKEFENAQGRIQAYREIVHELESLNMTHKGEPNAKPKRPFD